MSNICKRCSREAGTPLCAAWCGSNANSKEKPAVRGWATSNPTVPSFVAAHPCGICSVTHACLCPKNASGKSITYLTKAEAMVALSFNPYINTVYQHRSFKNVAGNIELRISITNFLTNFNVYLDKGDVGSENICLGYTLKSLKQP